MRGRRANFLIGTETSNRDRGEDRIALLLVQNPSHWTVDESGGDAIDGDAPLRDLGGERLGHADHARFRSRVVSLPRIALDADNRRDVYDSAKAPFQHAFQRGARQAEGRGQIDRKHSIPVLVLHANEQTIARDPGVVDEDVYGPKRAFDRWYQGFGRGGVRKPARRPIPPAPPFPPDPFHP